MTQDTVDLSLSALFKTIWRNKRLLTTIALVTLIVSSVISLVLTEYYKSSAVIFPARINSLSLNESAIKRGNISDFGQEEEAEQLLQIINSEAVQELVIEKNDLYDHYEIDQSEKYARSKIRQTYNGNVTAKRTKYNSIDISVIDEDPIIAANIANSISEFTDTVKNRMIQDRARTSMTMIDKENARLRKVLISIEEEVDSLQELGVMGAVERASLLEAYGSARGEVANRLSRQLDINRKLGDEYDGKTKQRDMIMEQIARFRNFRNQFVADAGIDIPQKFVVDRAVPADKKAYPVRWLIVAGSMFSILMFTLILLILRENYQSLFK